MYLIQRCFHSFPRLGSTCSCPLSCVVWLRLIQYKRAATGGLMFCMQSGEVWHITLYAVFWQLVMTTEVLSAWSILLQRKQEYISYNICSIHGRNYPKCTHTWQNILSHTQTLRHVDTCLSPMFLCTVPSRYSDVYVWRSWCSHGPHRLSLALISSRTWPLALPLRSTLTWGVKRIHESLRAPNWSNWPSGPFYFFSKQL